MIFYELPLAGAFSVEIEPRSDERGFFARAYCREEFQNHGLSGDLEQCNISFNQKIGTLRGLHFQAPPFWEEKLMRCTLGAIYAVVVDLRRDSPTFLSWHALELSQNNRQMLFAPQGMATGFQTLRDESEVFYQMSRAYQPGAERGVRFDDAAFGIKWPLPVSSIAPRDAAYLDFNAETFDE
jgi:dTDP-4-dehydrorhamnose 3,5-epimerase